MQAGERLPGALLDMPHPTEGLTQPPGQHRLRHASLLPVLPNPLPTPEGVQDDAIAYISSGSRVTQPGDEDAGWGRVVVSENVAARLTRRSALRVRATRPGPAAQLGCLLLPGAEQVRPRCVLDQTARPDLSAAVVSTTRRVW